MTTWTPETLVAFVHHIATGLHNFAGTHHVKSKVLATLHMGWRLDHKQCVMILCAGWAHERTNTGKSISGYKAQTL